MQNKKVISLIIITMILTTVFSIGIAYAASKDSPEISIPARIPGNPNSSVNIPITYKDNGNQISSITFSIDYDETWLEPDITDPYSITWNLPRMFNRSCINDYMDSKGEIDCVIYSSYPLETIPDNTILTVTLKTKNAQDGINAPIKFSTDPTPSLGDINAEDVTVSSVNGSVQFGDVTMTAYLPLLINKQPTPPPPNCSNLILNGGFEELYKAWYLPITNYQARYTNAVSYAGDVSMRTGINLADNIYSYSSAWQRVTIPSDATSTDLTFYYKPQTTEPFAVRLFANMISQTNNPFTLGLGDPLFDQQLVLILNEDTTHDRTLMSILSNSRTWTKSSEYDLSDYKGETIWVAFTTYNNGSGGKTAMYVDEVELEVCR